MTSWKADTLWEKAGIWITEVQTLLRQQYPDKPPLAHVHSFGCQQNVSEGERLMGVLALLGYTFTEDAANADLVLYHTCAIRENAEDRIYGTIGSLRHCKETRPNMILALSGCMVQQPHVQEKLKKSYPQVDLIFGTQTLHRLPELLYQALTEPGRYAALEMPNEAPVEEWPVLRDRTSRKANLPIMYGCNNFCSYCVVPYVRGRERSRTSRAVIEEFRSLVAEGYRDITLLGQNVNSYGRGLTEDIDFPGLLRKLNGIPGDFRIRFMSSHPKDAGPELIDAMAECEKVCNHLHLPVQCGSDRILEQMNRRYTVAHYLSLLDYARSRIPDIAVTSDIIVGFPGETEEDFQGTLSLMEKARYDSIFSFIYSKREGTKAASMPDPVTDEEKKERFQRLLAMQREVGFKVYDECVGKQYRVLVEGQSRSGPGYLTGRSDGFRIVEFPGSAELIGEFVDVTITESLGWALRGTIVL